MNDRRSRRKGTRFRRTDLSDEDESSQSVGELDVGETTDIHRTCRNELNSSLTEGRLLTTRIMRISYINCKT